MWPEDGRSTDDLDGDGAVVTSRKTTSWMILSVCAIATAIGQDDEVAPPPPKLSSKPLIDLPAQSPANGSSQNTAGKTADAKPAPPRRVADAQPGMRLSPSNPISLPGSNGPASPNAGTNTQFNNNTQGQAGQSNPNAPANIQPPSASRPTWAVAFCLPATAW